MAGVNKLILNGVAPDKAFIGPNDVTRIYLNGTVVYEVAVGQVPEVIATLAFTPAVLGQEYYFDSSVIIAGATSYGYNGTLPTGMTHDPATGIFAGTPTTEQSQLISVYGSNGTGQGDPSNSDDLTVEIVKANCVYYSDGTNYMTYSGDGHLLEGYNWYVEIKFSMRSFPGEYYRFIQMYENGVECEARIAPNNNFEFKGAGTTRIGGAMSLNTIYTIKSGRYSNGTTYGSLYDENGTVIYDLSGGNPGDVPLRRPTMQGFDGPVYYARTFALNAKPSVNWYLTSGSTLGEPSNQFPADPTYDLVYSNTVDADWDCTGGAGAPMITEWEGTEIILPLDSRFKMYVDWGDGTPLEVNVTNHTYAQAGRYRVTIYGYILRWNLLEDVDTTKFKAVVQLGEMGWGQFTNAFKGVTLDYFNTATYDISDVTDFSSMFEDAVVTCIDAIDTTLATDTTNMFLNSTITRPDSTEQSAIEAGSAWVNDGNCP